MKKTATNVNDNATDDATDDATDATYNAPRVLIVDDEQSMRELLTMMLGKEGCVVDTARHGEEAVEKLVQGERYHVILTDLKMRTLTGLDVLREAKEYDASCQVVIMTAHATAETALSAIRDGAYDYMIKPFKLEQARATIRRALEKHALVRENLYLRSALQERRDFGEIIGRSEKMQQVFDMISKVAPTPTIVLVTGESGTGKELAARAIHNHSKVRNGPFLPINCGAISENLIESELFGHKKGAFTGAVSDKKGLFEAAENGTVFLDEIGELPLNTQVRFLRVLQEKKIRPVGGTSEIPINCRIVAATNRDLFGAVQEGGFREDLYYRLNVLNIELPPLRDRGADVKLLIEYYIKRYARELENPVQGVTAEAMRILLGYSYPGNVRELQNIVERAVTLERNAMIGIDVLPYNLQSESFERVTNEMEIPDEGLELEAMVEKLERTLILKALERAGGIKKEAAKLLGITFRSMRYRLDKYNID